MDIWQVLMWIVVWFVVVVLWYYVYMMILANTYATKIEQKQQVLIEKRAELVKLKKDVSYQKFESAKQIDKEQTIVWWKTIAYLIELFDDLKTLDNNVSNVSLTDFQISIDHQVNLRWTVENMRLMFTERQWLLDRLTNNDFIESYDIPFYKKEGDVFEFVLDAMILQNDANAITH